MIGCLRSRVVLWLFDRKCVFSLPCSFSGCWSSDCLGIGLWSMFNLLNSNNTNYNSYNCLSPFGNEKQHYAKAYIVLNIGESSPRFPRDMLTRLLSTMLGTRQIWSNNSRSHMAPLSCMKMHRWWCNGCRPCSGAYRNYCFELTPALDMCEWTSADWSLFRKLSVTAPVMVQTDLPPRGGCVWYITSRGGRVHLTRRASRKSPLQAAYDRADIRCIWLYEIV